MEPDGNLLPNIIILLILNFCNAFFVASEIAIISLNDNKIKKMSKEGNKKAQLIEKLTAQPSKFLATIQIGVTVSGFLASAVAAQAFSAPLTRTLSWLPVDFATLNMICVVVITILLSYFTLVFGELVPKRMAMQSYEKISFAVSPVLAFCSVVFRPFVVLLSASANAILFLFGIAPNSQPGEVTEEEIRMLVEAGGERGGIEESEKEMINNIFEFDDRTVDEMMSHRTEMVAVETGASLREIIETALDSGYSRIPVFEGDIDKIIGVLYVKDLLSLVPSGAGEGGFSVESLLREPLYVLEGNSCMEVLSEFKAKKIQIAIVVDEYGGTSGLVTMEDLLETIVGSIQDEYDEEEEAKIAELGEGIYSLDGLTPLADIDKYFGLGLSAEDFDTIGGYIIDKLGRIPSEGEHPSVEAGGMLFIVREMDERRVARLEARRVPADEKSQRAAAPK